MPRQEYKELLQELLDELVQSEGSGDYRARLMIVGGELDDPEYVEIIEEQGGLVVTDSTCFGSRLMWTPVDEAEEDPIRALARYYVADRPSCPRMYGDQPKRISFTREMIEEFKVDGVIGERLLFCDQWVVEHYMTTQDLKLDGNKLSVTVGLTTYSAPLWDETRAAWLAQLQQCIGTFFINAFHPRCNGSRCQKECVGGLFE